MSLWFRHAANFGEHPKTLRLRRLAGRKADSAECGWWRILEAAKRYGSWEFDDEEHLAHAAGQYAPFITLYRAVGFLDGLSIHNGEEYQAPLTGAERVAKHRAGNTGSNGNGVTPTVTGVTPRENRENRESTQTVTRVTSDGLPNLDPSSITALEMRTGHTASQAGPKQLEEYDRLIGDHGLPAVLGAFDSVSRGERMTARQLVWGAVKLLEPFIDPKAIDKAARASETDKASKRRLEQTQKYLAELRSDA